MQPPKGALMMVGITLASADWIPWNEMEQHSYKLFSREKVHKKLVEKLDAKGIAQMFKSDCLAERNEEDIVSADVLSISFDDGTMSCELMDDEGEIWEGSQKTGEPCILYFYIENTVNVSASRESVESATPKRRQEPDFIKFMKAKRDRRYFSRERTKEHAYHRMRLLKDALAVNHRTTRNFFHNFFKILEIDDDLSTVCEWLCENEDVSKVVDAQMGVRGENGYLDKDRTQAARKRVRPHARFRLLRGFKKELSRRLGRNEIMGREKLYAESFIRAFDLAFQGKRKRF